MYVLNPSKYKTWKIARSVLTILNVFSREIIQKISGKSFETIDPSPSTNVH